MGLTRKKVTVRTKKGKTFQRSVMVRAEAIGKRAGGKKLNSLNPWETHHVEHVKTNTKLGQRQQAYGSSGPGSDHSFFATLIGHTRQHDKTTEEHLLTEHDTGTAKHAQARQYSAGRGNAGLLYGRQGELDRSATSFTWNRVTHGDRVEHNPWDRRLMDFQAMHGSENVTRVPQNPRKHVVG